MVMDQSMMNNLLPNSTNSMNGEEDKSEVFAYGKWYEMMRISGHSTPGLLLTYNNESSENSFMYLTNSGRVEISNFSHKFKKYYWSSCNGFMLESCPGSTAELMITNPAKNQQLPLPSFNDPTQTQSSAIAFVSTRKEYKVVRTYSHPHRTLRRRLETQRISCAILTVGVDNAWRLVDTQHLSLDSYQQLQLCPVVTEGFAHWVQDLYPISNGFVLTLNMETEIMTRYGVPRCVGGFHYYKYFSTGERNLSLLIARGHFQFNVCEMNSETGVWTKLFNMDLRAHEALFNESYDRDKFKDWFKPVEFGCRLYPAGWLKYREVVVFVIHMLTRDSFLQTNSIVVYNVQTKDITVLRLDHETIPPYLFHRDNQLIIHGMQD